MKIKLAPLFAIAGLALIATQVQANSLVDGSADAGKAKALTCTACHGPEGNSISAMWPNIAGQNAPYLLAQLAAFKDGSRVDPLMTSQAMMVSEQDMADLSAFYSSQAVQAGSADEKLVELGQKIYRGGNPASGVSACIGCHGPSGAGNPAASFPSLSGQHAKYVENQLNTFKSGERSNDAGKMMRTIASKMTEQEIKAVASYVQGLH